MSISDTTDDAADGESFFDCFNALIDNGWLHKLSPTQLRTYLVMLRRRNGKTGQAWPGSMNIADKAGHDHPGHIRKARAELVAFGLLTLMSKGGGRESSKYIVNVPPRTKVATPPRTKSVTGNETGPGSNSVSAPPTESVTPPPTELATAPGTKLEHRTENETDKKTPPSSAAPDDGGGGVSFNGSEEESDTEARIERCINWLRARDVREPRRSEIARIPGMMTEVLDKIWRDVEKTPNVKSPHGLFIKSIQERAASEITEELERQENHRHWLKTCAEEQEAHKARIAEKERLFGQILREATARHAEKPDHFNTAAKALPLADEWKPEVSLPESERESFLNRLASKNLAGLIGCTVSSTAIHPFNLEKRIGREARDVLAIEHAEAEKVRCATSKIKTREMVRRHLAAAKQPA